MINSIVALVGLSILNKSAISNVQISNESQMSINYRKLYLQKIVTLKSTDIVNVNDIWMNLCLLLYIRDLGTT